MSKRTLILIASSLFILTALAAPLHAQELEDSEEVKRSKEATEVLTEIMSIPEDTIPEKLMARAHGVAVIPHVVKGALVFGGQWGKGLMAQRHEDGTWGMPSFVEISGGSFGLQVGVQATDLVLVFTDEDGIKQLLKSKLKLGGDASVAAGPVGRKAELSTDVLLRSGVFAYSRSRGLFAGIALDGSVVSIDDNANAVIYGRNTTTEQILFGKAKPRNARINEFVTKLRKVSPSHVREHS